MKCDSEESVNCIPEDIIESATTATMNLLPAKSKETYLKKCHSFMDWRIRKDINSFTERVLLAYFCMKSKMWKSSTLWSTYAKLKAITMVNNDVDISKYSKLIAYLKNKSNGYNPKKSKTFSWKERFLLQAPDNHYPMHNVALIFRIAGALPREELYKMKCEDINDTENVLIITVPEPKTHVTSRFTIIGETSENNLNLIKIYKKYKTQRALNIKTIISFCNIEMDNAKPRL